MKWARHMRLGALALGCALVFESAAPAASPLAAASQGQLSPAPPSGGQSSSPATSSPHGLAPVANTVRGRYVDAVPSMTWGSGPDRDRLTLNVDVTPKPGMRVYAPGNKDYTPVQLTIDAGRDHTVASTKYPKPSLYLFVPLNQRVQVFDGAFRLSRELTRRSGAVSANSFTGRLEYQACDDKVCYLPQTVALTWTVTPK